jgi:predicted transport protein
MNQGLFYLDWLLDHKAEFKLLVMECFGAQAAEGIEWSAPRLLCIAGDYTRYDKHAVQQINRNIELLRYRRYGEDLLLLELVNVTSSQAAKAVVLEEEKPRTEIRRVDKTVEEIFEASPQSVQDLFIDFEMMVMGFGDDVQVKELKHYYAYKRIKNFATVEFKPSLAKLLVHVKVDPKSIELEEGFTKDVTGIGHWGTGDLEISIHTPADLEKAGPLLQQSYDQN